jgi:DedD protein
MGKNSDGQREVVLENRQVLAMFFVIVGFCGVFFALGYIVGRNTLSGGPAVAQTSSNGNGGAAKPSPMPPPAYQPSAEPQQPAAEASSDQSAATTDLNFYQSVEEKKTDAKLEPAEEPSGSPTTTVSSPAATSAPVQQASATLAAAPSPEQPPAFMVQVSALSRQEDANSLVKLLKDKRLPVFVLPGSTDRLFHVVVGPYPTQKDADKTKALLELEGFRPIVKR